MFIPTLGRDIVFKPRTRKVTKAINATLFEGVVIDAQNMEREGIKIPFNNTQKADEVMVMLLTDLTAEEIDALTDKEYDALLKAIADSSEEQKKS